jgi:hypothetical protein
MILMKPLTLRIIPAKVIFHNCRVCVKFSRSRRLLGVLKLITPTESCNRKVVSDGSEEQNEFRREN